MKANKSDTNLVTVMNSLKQGDIDIQPDFQRGEVWDLPRRQRLIDTILRDWYVPAVHIVVRKEDNFEQVLDGQQRLESIRRFFDDEISIDGNFEPLDPDIQRLHGLKYSQLPDRIRRQVDRFNIQVVYLSDHNPQEPNELFFRLNQAYALTPPEKRNALHGPARDQIKKLVQDLTSRGLLTREAVGFSNGRLAYDDIIARVCVAIEQATLRKHINNNVVETYYRGGPFSENTIFIVSDAGAELHRQISACTSKIRFNKGTLQSWLIFIAKAAQLKLPLPETLLQDFESDRLIVRNGSQLESSASREGITQILRLYDDRASYRVTDVSSVLTRDLALHTYAMVIYDVQLDERTQRYFEEVQLDPAQAQGITSSFLEDSDWGTQPSGNSAA